MSITVRISAPEPPPQQKTIGLPETVLLSIAIIGVSVLLIIKKLEKSKIKLNFKS